MTRMVARENSGPPELKDPRVVRVDMPGKRKLNERIVEDRRDPTANG